MNAPILSVRQAVAPYATISSLTYSETVANQSGLPTLSGDKSDQQIFRIYNNYSTPPSASIATANNLYITTYDGASSASHTASTVPVVQMWLFFQENGFGEQSSIPGLYTLYPDVGAAVGGSQSIKIFSYGSDGTANSYIRAGSDGNSVGFIEVNTYAAPSLGQATNIWNLGISIHYEWTT